MLALATYSRRLLLIDDDEKMATMKNFCFKY